VLQPIGRQPSAVMSATDTEVPKNARTEYDQGLDAAAKTKWAAAIRAIEKANRRVPEIRDRVAQSGIAPNAQNDIDAALDSYAQAIAADDKFAAAYVELAELQAETGYWSHALSPPAKPSLSIRMPSRAPTISLHRQ